VDDGDNCASVLGSIDEGPRPLSLTNPAQNSRLSPQFECACSLPSVLPPASEPYVTRVVFHSIFWGYLEPEAQALIAAHLATVGAAAVTERPLAWLRLELAGRDEPAALKLTLWPGGADEVLASAHPHGAWVRWQGE
jgi:hypothetical protein